MFPIVIHCTTHLAGHLGNSYIYHVLMNLTKKLHIGLIACILVSYIATFVVLVAFHTHQSTLGSIVSIQASKSPDRGTNHPTSCIVCSRICSNQPILGNSNSTGVNEVIQHGTVQFLESYYQSQSFDQCNGRAPPHNSL